MLLKSKPVSKDSNFLTRIPPEGSLDALGKPEMRKATQGRHMPVRRLKSHSRILSHEMRALLYLCTLPPHRAYRALTHVCKDFEAKPHLYKWALSKSHCPTDQVACHFLFEEKHC